MRHLIEPTNLSTKEIDDLMNLATDIINHKEKYSEVCKGKKLATLFYEPSTRTRLSFTAAMMELGGNVLGFSDAASSSVSKGETVADTVRVISQFADIIAMRHPKEGAPYIASQYSEIPIINAGDGGHSHPTQTLTDMLTIHREIGRFNNLTIGLCGDLKYGRTVHSLIKAMCQYDNIKFVLIAPDELRLPEYVKQDVEIICNNKNLPEFVEISSLEEAIPMLDVLYMTRVQQERFANKADYERLKDSFILDKEKMQLGKPNMIVLHPRPRVNEITQEVDDDPRAAYFRQVRNGKYVRMALIYTLLQWKEQNKTAVEEKKETKEGPKCTNPHCITTIEKQPNLYSKEGNEYRCIYCQSPMPEK